VWLAEPGVRMPRMAVLMDGCWGLRGGAMAGAIHGLMGMPSMEILCFKSLWDDCCGGCAHRCLKWFGAGY
jgi:hypothetical protein